MRPGKPYPLGPVWDGLGVNFAVFSAHAERVELCVFDPSGRRELARYDLPACTDQVWHGYLPDAGPGTVYGFRAHGPYHPADGHRFNPFKLLLDPYARAITEFSGWSDALYGYRATSARRDLSFDRRDSASFAPKAVVVAEDFAWGDDVPPATSWGRTVIYEAHVKGFTALHPAVPDASRGRYAALGHPAVIAHLRGLGVTALELLPVHSFLNDRFLLRQGLRNYWGYNTLGFFAPHAGYGSANELRGAIRRLHGAGIEVILDVVYNHTAEGGAEGPTLSFRGLDNASYYRSDPQDRRRCIDDTGCGNTVNLAHPRVLQMVMDSLRFWVTSFHVDGFRFDLSPVMGREAHGFDPGAGFFGAVRQDPVLSRVKLIAEPWDLGPGGYQLGRHPPGWAEWNDRFRDGVRRFWRGDGGQRPDFAARLAGSADVFRHQGRRPWASVNFAACHDGFTLADVTRYAVKHNEANGENNRDGAEANWSANWGVEGPSDDPAIAATRARVGRAMLACVFLAEGTPMLLAGDEMGHSQRGNNNAYCQDNELSWLDWGAADGGLVWFVGRLTALRAGCVALRHSVFLYGGHELHPGIADIAWFDQRGAEISPEAWNDAGETALVLRRAALTEEGTVVCATLLLNPGADDRIFVLPGPLPARLVLDSARPEQGEREVGEGGLTVLAHSLALVIAEISG